MRSITQLHDQKRTVLIGMADSKDSISILEDKVSKLKEASSKLGTSISMVENLKKSISDLTIDLGEWKGKEKKNFEEAYSTYKENVHEYHSRTEEAQEAIEEDIRRYEADIDMKTIGLNNLENMLDSLDRQIKQANGG